MRYSPSKGKQQAAGGRTGGASTRAMRRVLVVMGIFAVALLGASPAAWGQSAVASAAATSAGWSVAVHQPASFSQTQLECSDFYAPGFYPDVHRLIGANAGMETSLLTAGQVVYFNAAAGLHAGDSVRLLRVGDQSDQVEQFPNQQRDLRAMGTRFTNVGRAEILSVNPGGTATARIDFSCVPAKVGDFAIAWKPTLGPKLATSETINLLTPLRGRAQLIAAGRDMSSELGTGSEVYITGGERAGLHPGQRWLIFRSTSSPSQWQYRTASEGMKGMPYGEPGLDVAKLEASPRPAEIVGEATLLRVDPDAATAVITYARDRIMPGDGVIAER